VWRIPANRRSLVALSMDGEIDLSLLPRAQVAAGAGGRPEPAGRRRASRSDSMPMSDA